MVAYLPEWIWLLGRALLGAFYALAGFEHLFAVAGLTEALAARGVPAPRFVLLAGTAFQIVAGVALIFGVAIVWAALGLIVFTLVASALLVNFWSMDGAARQGAIRTWQSNFAVIGGLLLTVAHALR